MGKIRFLRNLFFNLFLLALNLFFVSFKFMFGFGSSGFTCLDCSKFLNDWVDVSGWIDLLPCHENAEYVP